VANKAIQTAKWMSAAGVIAAAVAFTPTWEGMDSVAKRDMIGTGHPITYCNGLTSVDGSVKVGQRFTKAQCDEKLAEALPKYLAQIEPCIHRQLPDKTAAALLDGAFNAGPGAVCRSPMLAKMNAGDLRGGCNAFEGWYIRSDGVVRPGLIDRRDGEDHGDHRLSEKGLCLQGLKDGTKSNTGTVVGHLLNSKDSIAVETPITNTGRETEMTPTGETVNGKSVPWPKGDPIVVHKKHAIIPKKHEVVCTGFWIFKECK
jgi:lysozyme